VYLDLSGNDFSGSPITKFIGSMKQLTHPLLSEAGFSGSAPGDLVYLDLSSNAITDWEAFGVFYGTCAD